MLVILIRIVPRSPGVTSQYDARDDIGGSDLGGIGARPRFAGANWARDNSTWNIRHAGVLAGRNAGVDQGALAVGGVGDGIAGDPGEHLSPDASARRAGCPRVGRSASVHGLARSDIN